MSHHTSLPPEVDDAVRSFIRRHKRGLRWGCLAAALLALVLLAVAAWGLYRGAILLKDVVKDSVGGISRTSACRWSGKSPSVIPPWRNCAANTSLSPTAKYSIH